MKKLKLREFLSERGLGGGSPVVLAGGASFAYVFGAVLMFLLGLEAITGVALAAFYSPSATDAWGSVAYLQDQASWGWIIRGLHYHGASAIVVVAGMHLVQTALYGAYKKPRELVWWLGVLLLILMLAWAVTGYVLRWDQAGFWANKVEVGIAAATPLIGDTVKKLALGGNDYGNLTLTRFYTLHVIVLPAIVGLVTAAHVMLARKYGPTARREREQKTAPRWPDQMLRNTIAIALAFSILLAYVIGVHGVELAAPADPSQAYDARPLWYFRWLFELREIAGSGEKIAALVAPALVSGILIALPLMDRKPARDPGQRKPYLGLLTGVLALISGLTIASLLSDSRDGELAKRQAKAEERAGVARQLARDNGVPASGALDVFFSGPMAKARANFAQRCEGCHDAESKDRKGPIITFGHGNRAWLKAFITSPSSEPYWGRTKLAKTDTAMKPFDHIPEGDLDDIVEAIYAESGASDAIASKRERGAKLFEAACGDCHSRDDGQPGSSAPGLGGLGSRDYYRSFVSNPKSALHMGVDKSEMPKFDKDLSLVERDGLAEYLVWLRTATKADLDALGPL